ncbi:MAG: hypothetical protein J6N15_08000 [Ruminiclostridium sp.]|nr:hypothetical protein [Ruminiclostridium sp.]
MAGKRIKELDIIKGAGILLISVIHLVYRPQNGAADYLLRAAGWFLISVYLMMAGYSFSAGKRTPVQNYLHRLRTLVLPAVIIDAALFAVGGAYCALVHGYTFADWWHDLAVTALRPELCTHISPEWGSGGVLFNNISPSWFIWTMAFTELVFFPAAQLCARKGRTFRLCAVGALTAVQIPLYIFVSPLPHQLQLIPLFTAFMLIGAQLRDSGLLNREWRFNIPVTALIAVICLAAHFGIFMLGGDESYYRGQLGYVGGFDILLTLVQLPVGFAGYYALAVLAAKTRLLSRGLVWIGQHTLTILLCHCFFGMIAADILQTYIKPGPMWYVENAGLTVTPEIFLRSLAGQISAIACSCGIAVLRDRLTQRKTAP